VWHNAAAVGPFHPQELYMQVNYQGTLNVIAACEKHGVTKIVMSSSPSTRFTGEDIDGLTEDDLPPLPLKSYMQECVEHCLMVPPVHSNVGLRCDWTLLARHLFPVTCAPNPWWVRCRACGQHHLSGL
jgi:hypothetical protein